MKELLERWAELEPERCKWVPNEHQETKWDCWFILGQYIYPSEFPFDDWSIAVIQCAVQQAIEARGWNWHLMSIVPHAHAARITKGKISNEYRLADSQEDYPAHALLSAYIKALEAENE